ncbi:arylamine N-acetyltransferase family protein [Nocardia seriolae]|uniref:arylamine N-acetyltransferase family protein n=1 Tax=Nocardia seriolae TaxID=37332 RepID=UPI0009095B25|nr:arylamine N-acetyltransferase [Nocardia seriolae]MTJ62420.1 arylamine N-acetyltransferase [Nocardia seriolae]MTJ75994.1 arylamine N-acetyltransferase [Nocardia seriolae]MTJ87323.1 arylamine N-acetyltransferase [Nocardia seriolae]MTK31317.1 arylamine N-acetyltransferase [Nocardia seriolae]MTK40368.1 arylamine N-acetyltransferase [Nocardia seriolae]
MTTPVDPAYTWQGEDLDLDAYLTRIGFTGERTPTLATLRELVRAHTTVIPFENLEIILGRGIPLDPDSLRDKMIRRRRGGYCYENVGLFAAALERIGFEFTAMSGRVTRGAVNLRPATHALLRVKAADDPRFWLCDVGFGWGPLEPVELTPNRGEFSTGAWRFRLERTLDAVGGELWTLYQFGRDGFVDRYTFATTPQYRIDFAVGNHYVSTSERSPFVMRPFVQRFHAEVHHQLDGTTWTTSHPDGSEEVRELEVAELPKVLAEVFDVELDAADAAQLERAQWPAAVRASDSVKSS